MNNPQPNKVKHNATRHQLNTKHDNVIEIYIKNSGTIPVLKMSFSTYPLLFVRVFGVIARVRVTTGSGELMALVISYCVNRAGSLIAHSTNK